MRLRAAAILCALAAGALGVALPALALGPACPLLPLDVPEATDGDVAVNALEACVVLAHPLPQARYLPLGMQRVGILVTARDPIVHRFRGVLVRYAIESDDVAVLYLTPGELVGYPLGDALALPRATAIVTQEGAERTYTWDRDALVYALRIELTHGLTGAEADDVARSIQ